MLVWEDKVKNDDIRTLRKLEDIIKEKTEMVGACPTNGGFQKPQQTVGTERIREEAGTVKGELDGHRETQPEEHGHQLGGGRRAGGGQDAAMNRTEQNARVGDRQYCIF